MEIPTKEIVRKLNRLSSRNHNLIPTTEVALEALSVIRAQALEIRELQARICQMRCRWDVSLEHGE